MVCVLSRFSCVQLCATQWTTACQVPLSMGFSRQGYWSGLLCPPPGDLPNTGVKPTSLPSKLHRQMGFFTTSNAWEEYSKWNIVRETHILYDLTYMLTLKNKTNKWNKTKTDSEIQKSKWWFPKERREGLRVKSVKRIYRYKLLRLSWWPKVKTQCLQCRGLGIQSSLGNEDPTSCMAWPKETLKLPLIKWMLQGYDILHGDCSQLYSNNWQSNHYETNTIL